MEIESAVEVKGFSLVELLIIIGIVSFLSIIMVMNIRGVMTHRVKVASRRLVSDIAYVKKMAEATQTVAGIYFYPVEEKYVVYQTTFTAVASDPVSKKPMVRDFTIGEFSRVNIVSAAFPVGTEYLEFDPLGRNSIGGRVVLSYDNETYYVDVEPNTGRASYTKQ